MAEPSALWFRDATAALLAGPVARTLAKLEPEGAWPVEAPVAAAHTRRRDATGRIVVRTASALVVIVPDAAGRCRVLPIATAGLRVARTHRGIELRPRESFPVLIGNGDPAELAAVLGPLPVRTETRPRSGALALASGLAFLLAAIILIVTVSERSTIRDDGGNASITTLWGFLLAAVVAVVGLGLAGIQGLLGQILDHVDAAATAEGPAVVPYDPPS